MPKAKTKATVEITTFIVNALGDIRTFNDMNTGEARTISNFLGYMRRGEDTVDHISYAILDKDIETAKKMLAHASKNNLKLVFEFTEFKLDSSKHDTWTELYGHVTSARFIEKPKQSLSASVLALASSIA